MTFTRGFEMMPYEVRQDLFLAMMGYNPSQWSTCGDDCPLECVNWYEAAAFTNALSEAAGYPLCYECTGSMESVTCTYSTTYPTPYDCPGYRLSTESEWEYAARAGSTDATYFGTSTFLGDETPNAVLDPIAWFDGSTSVRPGHPGRANPALKPSFPDEGWIVRGWSGCC